MCKHEKVKVDWDDEPTTEHSVDGDIPWFGTSQWETMYDWPEYRQFSRQHISIQQLWEPRLLRDKNLSLPLRCFSGR